MPALGSHDRQSPAIASHRAGSPVAFALDVCGSVGLFGLGGGADPNQATMDAG